MSHRSFVCTQLNGFEYSKWLNNFTWYIDGILTGTSTPVQSGTGSNVNEVSTSHSPKL